MARTIEEMVQVMYGTHRAHALKRGRNPKWPYVPVMLWVREKPPFPGQKQEQIKGLAFATREEAVEAAQKGIDFLRDKLRKDLASPYGRAMREQWGVTLNG